MKLRLKKREKAQKALGSSERPIPVATQPTLRLALLFGLTTLVLGILATSVSSFKQTRSVSEIHRNISNSIAKSTIGAIDDGELKAISKPSDVNRPAFSHLKKSIYKHLKRDPKIVSIATYRLINGKLTMIFGATSGKSPMPKPMSVVKPIPPALKKCFATGIPTSIKAHESRDISPHAHVYTRISLGDGKFGVVETQISGAVYARDFEEIAHAKRSGYLYAVVLGFAMAGIGYIMARRNFSKEITLSKQVIKTSTQLVQKESELSEAVNRSKELTASLVRTLLSAGCLVWQGHGALGRDGKFTWAGELKYQSPFDWLNRCLDTGATFDTVWDGLRDPGDLEAWHRAIQSAITSGEEMVATEYRVHLGENRTYWFSEQLRILRDSDGTLALDGFIHDISDTRKKSEEVRRLAFYDNTTGLINRTRIHDLINELLITSETVSVIGVEISNFRNINESWGAELGDALLKNFGETLQAEVAPQGGIVGRLAGDDFVIIVSDPNKLTATINQVDELCQRASVVEGVEIAKVCRMGYVTSESGETAVGLIRKVNLALENARKNQTPFAVAYKPEMSFRAKMRVELEAAMRQALFDGEFYLMFQPIVCNKTRQVVKAEALLRWNSSRFGAVSPATFIPIAEESDFINDLGNYVIDETARRISMLQQELNLPDFAISMNLSLRQLKNPATLNVFKAALQRWGVRPQNMIIEVTESSIMHDAGECVAMLNMLRDQGFVLAIDDFGTGYSSLATLASLPFGCLKIDKRFVDGIGIDSKQQEVLHTIVRLARALNLQIVAEGIEHEQQYQFLRELGVEFSQGYYFGKPLAFEDLVVRTSSDSLAA